MPNSNVNIKGLLGEIVPNVYVDCITLETADDDVMGRDNPHIREHPLERSANTTDQSMKIQLDLIMKESLDDTLVSNWFKELDLLKYLTINAYQSFDPNATWFLSNNASFLPSLKILKEAKLKEWRIEHKLISVSAEPASKLNQHYSYIDQDGNRIHDITYRVDFGSADAYPKHMAFVVVPSLDLEKLANDFNLNLSNGGSVRTSGKVVTEVVIDDFKTVSRSYIYRTASGDIWPGEVHRTRIGDGDDARWKYSTGRSRPTVDTTTDDEQTRLRKRMRGRNSVPLTRVPTFNFKIQDFRDLQKIETLSIEFDNIERNLLPDIDSQGVVNSQVLDTDRRNSLVFTDSFISRNPDGSCRFLFGINYREVIKNNSLFRAFVNNASLSQVQTMMGSSRIRSIKFIRQRVKAHLGAGAEPFDLQATPEILAFSGQDGGKIRDVSNDRASLTEIDLFHEGNHDFRHFTGVDWGMRFITDGIYKYRVELEIEDGVAAYLKGLLGSLYTSKSFLERYYNLALIPGNFNANSNKFEQEFITLARRDLVRTGDWFGQVWSKAIETYIGVLDVVSRKSFDWIELSRKLHVITSPNSGSPRGIEFFINLLNNLIAQFQNILSSHNVFPNNSNLELKSEKVHKKAGIQKFTKITKYFDETFNSDRPKFTGYDFLATSGIADSDGGMGLRTIRGNEFLRRTDLETSKYYPTPDQDINFSRPGSFQVTGHDLDRNALGYLSVATVNVQGLDPLILLTENGGINLDGERYSEVMSAAMEENINIEEGGPPPGAHSSNRPPPSGDGAGRTLGQSDGPSRFARILALGNVIAFPLNPEGQADYMNHVPHVDTLVSEKVFGETKTGTDVFPITEERSSCPQSTLRTPARLGVYLTTTEVVSEQIINGFAAVNSSNGLLRHPLLKSSYELGGINGPFSNVAAPAQFQTSPARGTGDDGGQGSSEGTLTAAPTTSTPAHRYAEQVPDTDCDPLRAVSETTSQPAEVRDISTAPESGIPTTPDIRNLPNQTYSLFLAGVNPSAVVNDLDFVLVNDVDDMTHTPAFNDLNWTTNLAALLIFLLNYKNLMEVQVLMGYQRERWHAGFGRRVGRQQPKVPIWKTMDHKIYKDSIGKNLLCRLKPYHDSVFSTDPTINPCDMGEGCISRSRVSRSGPDIGLRDMSLPVLHKYFILVPEERGATLNVRRPQIIRTADTSGEGSDEIGSELIFSPLVARFLSELDDAGEIPRELIVNNIDQDSGGRDGFG